MLYFIGILALAVVAYFVFVSGNSTTEKDSQNRWRDEQMRDAEEILVSGLENNNNSKISEGLDRLNVLMKKYPDFAKPFIRTLQMALRAKQYDLAKSTLQLMQDRFADHPEVKSNLSEWMSVLEKIGITEQETSVNSHVDEGILQYFAKAKGQWDDGKNDEAFGSYLKGLEKFTANGNKLTNESPLAVRIAFRACRMFSLDALNAGNSELGAQFMSWCEVARVDMNEEIDVSDAKK